MKKSILTLLFAFVLCGLKAQSYELVIRLNDNSETTWTHESLGNIYFDGENTLVVIENGSMTTHQYEVSEINKMYFKEDVSISDINFNNPVFIYPNPAKDNIKIFGVENQEIEIFSTDGKLILKENYNGKDIDISSLHQGLYLIKTNCQTLKFNKI